MQLHKIGRSTAEINTNNLILKAVQLCRSVGGEVDDVAGVLELMALADIAPLLNHITFAEIPEGLKKLERGEVKGRLVEIID